MPLVTGPPDILVLDLLNCPSLHIMIGICFSRIKTLCNLFFTGVVNKLISELQKNAFANPTEGEKWVEEFLKKVIIY